METKDLIEIVNNKTLPKSTRLNALNEILRIPAPGALKNLLDNDKVLNVITIDIHENGAGSSLFWIIYKAFEL